MAYPIGDLSGYLITDKTEAAKARATAKKDNMGLEMTDFLMLMVTQLQSQTIDNTADTSDMLNQLVQMQMITALTNMTDASIMSYASSLVGKEVTVGYYENGTLVEEVGTVMGTGVSNGDQVVFVNDKAYKLNEIMAVGRLPEIKPEEEPEEVEETEEFEGFAPMFDDRDAPVINGAGEQGSDNENGPVIRVEDGEPAPGAYEDDAVG